MDDLREKVIGRLDEAAEYFRECRNNASLGSKAENHFWELQSAMREAAERLKARETGWISVRDRMPSQSGKYLIVAVEYGRIQHVTAAKFGTYFYMTGRMAHWKVTHWMPLPEPPKEE